jgi:hypothetical protein
MVLGVVNIAPCIGQIISFIVGIAVGPYLTAVSGHLYGQIAAKGGGKGEKFVESFS